MAMSMQIGISTCFTLLGSIASQVSHQKVKESYDMPIASKSSKQSQVIMSTSGIMVASSPLLPFKSLSCEVGDVEVVVLGSMWPTSSSSCKHGVMSSS